MVDSNEQDQTTSPLPTEEKIDPPEVSPNKPSSCPGINKLTLFFAAAALAFTGYNFYSSHQLTANLTAEKRELVAKLQQLQEQQNSDKQALEKQNDALNNSNQQLAAKIKEFSTQVQSIRQKGNQSQDWLLLKARYYLELAQINAHWATDINAQSTIALLQQADLTLEQMNAAELFKIRQIIAQELLELKSAHHLDLPGLLSQLDAIQSSITQLPVQKTLAIQADSATQSQPPEVSGSLWKTQLNNSLDMLGKLVVIRRNDEEIKPLLSPVFESLIKESLELNIQEAQWAILNQNPIAYQLALNQAITTLQRGFNKQTKTNRLIQQLKELQKLNLVGEKIEVGKALPLINALIEQRQVLNPGKTNNQGGQV
ncbi:uroporphyrinogen-III C-methyltransferase [Legionella sp. km772]|uniref:uroporphyrinogen-III C-methyltransferase n=1 Tax=Legionella sp. km772 TaxID=2498111 RepID=UPI000F8CDB57|nr:uroporphyrinogen-III C-methyltransferase [Legionella sp. km772]RUR12023.1 hypothetical protein ELY15_06405 [Legionella sp. km772]